MRYAQRLVGFRPVLRHSSRPWYAAIDGRSRAMARGVKYRGFQRGGGMRNGGNAFAFIAAVLTFSSASAATITATTSKENKTIVSLNGEITEGDAGKLKELIRSASET